MRRSYLFPLLAGFWTIVFAGTLVNLFSNVIQHWIDTSEADLWSYAPLSTGVLVLLAVLTIWEGWAFRAYHASLEFKLFKPTEKLRPEDVEFVSPLSRKSQEPVRPYTETYIERVAVDYDEPDSSPKNEQMIENALKAQRNVVLIGQPTEGKTRTLYEVMRRLPGYHVVIPKGNALPSDAALALCKKRQLVLFLNDLNDYAGSQLNLTELTIELRKQAQSVVIAATCRDGAELDVVQGAFATGLQRFYTDIIRNGWKLRLRPASAGEKRKLKESLGTLWQPDDDARFATLGAVVMEKALVYMKERFAALPPTHVDVLRALKLLNAAGILPYTRARLQAVLLGIFDRQLRSSELDDYLDTLTDQSFLYRDKETDNIRPERAYVDQIVKYERHNDDPTKDFPALITIWEEAQDVEALRILASTFFALQDEQNAKECFMAAIRIEPIFSEQLREDADHLYKEERYPEALRLYDYLLFIEPENAEAWGKKGYILGELERHKEALLAFDKEIVLNPADPKGWYYKGFALVKLGQSDEGLAAFDKALSINPDYAEAWRNKGAVLSILGRHEGALAAFDKTIALKLDDRDAWYNKGFSLRQLGQLTKALAAYDRAIALKPEDPATWYEKGSTLGDLGRHSEELMAYDKAIEYKSDYFDAWLNKGAILSNIFGQHLEALAAHERAIAFKPDHSTAWNNKGATLGKLGRKGEALAAYEQAIALKPNFPLAWNGKGITLGEERRYAEALAAFEKAIEYYCDYTEAWANKGRALKDLGRHAEALAAYEKAIELQPDYYSAWKNRGDCLEKLGRQEEAQEVYKKVALEADDPDLLRRVADLLEARGAPYEAAQARVRAGKLENEKHDTQ